MSMRRPRRCCRGSDHDTEVAVTTGLTTGANASVHALRIGDVPSTGQIPSLLVRGDGEEGLV